MMKLSLGWLSASLFLFYQLGASLVFEEVSADHIVPAAFRATTTGTPDHDDFSMLDLLSRDSFFWTGTQNGHLALANLTIDLPGDGETIVSLDTFSHMLKTVQCTDETMTLEFKNDDAYGYIKRGWQWLNDADPRKLIIITGAGKCGSNPTRTPFSASSIIFNDAANTAMLTGEIIAWSEFQDYELTVGRYEPATGSYLAQRDFSKSMSLDFNHNLPFSSGTIKTPADDAKLTWLCSDCGTSGTFDFGFHIETRSGILTGASITMSPNGVSATLNPRIAIQADLSGDIDDEWEIGKIPIGGISIPGGILDVGPQIEFSMGYAIGPLKGSAGLKTGITVSIPDDAVLEIGLIPADIGADGWEPEVDAKPVELDAQLTGEISVYVKASVDLALEALGKGFEAGINLKPYIGAAMTAQTTTDEVCDGENNPFGIKVYPKAGVSLNADVSLADKPEDPLAEAVIATVTAPLPTDCIGFGGGSDGRAASSTSSVPSSTPSSTSSSSSIKTPPASSTPVRVLTPSPTKTPSQPPSCGEEPGMTTTTRSPTPSSSAVPSSSYPSSSYLFRRGAYTTKVF